MQVFNHAGVHDQRSDVEACGYIDTLFLCILWKDPNRYSYFEALYCCSHLNAPAHDDIKLLMMILENEQDEIDDEDNV